ncbi:MAG: chemotaxis protein CheW [Gemmatimonadaceae bacterium]
MASSTNATTSPPPPPRPPAATDAAARPGQADTPSADASPDDGPPDGGPQLLAFVVAGRLFGCPLADVREIIPARPATRLPGAPPHVLGLVNLRGTLLTVLDLALALGPREELALAPLPTTDHAAGPPAAPAATVGHVLVVEADGRRVGCRAEAVRRVYPMPALISPTVIGNVEHSGIVLGIGDAGDTMVVVLDLPALARQTLLSSGER